MKGKKKEKIAGTREHLELQRSFFKNNIYVYIYIKFKNLRNSLI